MQGSAKAVVWARGALLAAVVVLCSAWLPTAAAAAPVTVTNYTSPSQALAWGQKSHWIQPWRSYLDTVPATTLLNAIGINFNVKGSWAPATAKLLRDSGFTRARLEVSWRTIDFANPDQMIASDREELVTKLKALKENGIRPLVLLNSNHGAPCPIKLDAIQLTSPANTGDTEIHVSPSDVAKLAPGRTGINSGGVAAQYLFTSVSPDGTVHLSAPLGSLKPPSGTGITELPAGALAVETLLYEPFHPAKLENGSADPLFESTMQGWLNYIHVVTREVKAILGSEDFDVEIWNELSFGSRFLSTNNYYNPDLPGSSGSNTDEVLKRSIAYLRDPAHGVPNIGIGDGFANQTPWPSAANTPVGLTAIDKHLYPKILSWPEASYIGGNRPLNGLGEPAGIEVIQNGSHFWQEEFTPTYEAFFPEYFLSGIQTETVVHDISPIMSKVGGIEHGRFVHAPGGQPATEWFTEFNLNPTAGPVSASEMSQADIHHIETKIVLRSLAAFVNKGVTALHFYAAKAGNYSLVSPSFFSSLKGATPVFPGDAAGGETTDAVRRLVGAMQGAKQISSPRSLSLRELTDFSSNKQFDGNGTAQYPPLYNRDVLAFLPFQATARRFVIPVYVMTRNMAKIYNPSTEPSRFDMPEEPYQLDIGGIDGRSAEVGATDPLTGKAVPVRVVSRGEQDIKVELKVTDSPRLLTVQEPEGTAPVPPPPSESPSPVVGGGKGGGKSGKVRTSAQAVVEVEGTANRRPRVALRNGSALLDQRQIKVIARFPAPYTLRVKGSLSIAGRSLSLSSRRSAGELKVTRQGPMSVPLKLSASTARLAMHCLEQGKSVRLGVEIGTRHKSGKALLARRSWPVGP